jgi:hypothetical protein
VRHSLFVLTSFIVALGVAVSPRTALATVTNLSATSPDAAPPACPANVHVTVAVRGTGNVPITISLAAGAYYVGEAQKLDAGGTFAKNYVVAIGSALPAPAISVRVVDQSGATPPLTQTIAVTCPTSSVSSVTMKGSMEHLSCPAVASASADVSGTAGQTFIATLEAHIGSKTTVLPAKSFVMPASGTMNVPFDLRVPQLHDSTSYALLSVQAGTGNARPVSGVLKMTCDPITLAQASVDLRTNGAWRPYATVHYSNELTSVSVKVRFPGTAPVPDGATCGFETDLVNILGGIDAKADSRQIFKTTTSTEDGTNDVTYDVGFDFTKTPPGIYTVFVKPVEASGGPPACAGASPPLTFVLRPPTAWITGLDLYGIGYYFEYGQGDQGLSQFCSACNTPYSPGHPSAFLNVVPKIQGTTQSGYPWGGKCVYNLAFYGSSLSGNNTFHLGQQLKQTVTNGQPLFPPSEEFKGEPGQMGNPTNPWWSQWDHDTNTAQVVISEASDPNIASCNVLGEKDVISNTLTFTNNHNAPEVHH